MQTAYSEQLVVALEGMKADIAGVQDVLSFNNPAVAMPFGKLAVRSTNEDECKLPVLSTDVTDTLKVLGLVLASQNMPVSSSTLAEHVVKSQVPVLRKGRAWVKVEEAVTVASTVHVRYAAGGNGLGSFGDTTGTSERAPLAGAKYLTSAAADGLAIVEFNL